MDNKIEDTTTIYNVDEEFLNALINDVSKPTFNFLIKRLNKVIIHNTKCKNFDANLFYNLILASSATINANLLKWIESFHKIKTNEQINIKSLEKSMLDIFSETLQRLKIVASEK